MDCIHVGIELQRVGFLAGKKNTIHINRIINDLYLGKFNTRLHLNCLIERGRKVNINEYIT